MNTTALLKGLGLTLLCTTLGLSAQAQTAARSARANPANAAGQDPIVARITDMSRPDRSVKELPAVNTSPKENRLRRDKREWSVLDVTYETAPEWIEELQITYAVLAEVPRGVAGRPGAPKEQYSLYILQETYTEIAKGQHFASITLPPTAIIRFGRPILFGVEITVNGRVQGVQTTGSVKGIDIRAKPDWWRGEQMRSEAVAQRNGYLKDRSRTPWAIINPDDYETVK